MLAATASGAANRLSSTPNRWMSGPHSMAKQKTSKKSTKKKARPATRRLTPPSLRRTLQRLDRKLLDLLNQRAKLAAQLGRMLLDEGEAACNFQQADESLAQLLQSNKGPLPPRAVEAVFRELTSACHALVKTERVAFLGPQYSYSYLAAVSRFGQSVELVPVGSIAAVFEEVNRGHADYGLVPLENSTDGRVADTLEMFAKLRVRICAEVPLEIHHALLGKCKREEIMEVYSRPQALSQCRNWLAKHLPAARTVEVTSTSTAAQLAGEKPGAAAIASIQAGVHYGLDVLAERIEDNPGNTTRFAVIGKQSAPRSGNDKTAMMFQVEHRPGALAEAMMIFKRNRLNLTWIESFPVPGCRGAYLFFVEMEGHESDLRIRRAVASLEKKTLRLEILGAYPAACPVS